MAKYDLSIREEELKNLVRDDWFGNYDGNKIIGNIDLSVCVPTDPNQLEIFDLDFFLWAEAKKGNKEDIDDSLVQLIITIMKARTYNDYLPPLYLGAFDAEKIAFIPYDDKLQRQVIFDQVLENDIDWTKITPSDHDSGEFQLVKKKAKNILLDKIKFNYAKEEKELRLFIKKNFIAAKTGTNKINITLNRMTSIFNRWLEEVKPSIDVPWQNLAKQYNILPADFFLADVISKNNQSLGASLQVLLRSNIYEVTQQTLFLGKPHKSLIGEVKFKDNQKAHKTFWNKYTRPPRRKERLSMQERRDLLVEPDRRERKGAYFTPHQWVDLSQEYLTNTLGPDWQKEYYIWDCCAGTGNLLYGLTEKERIFASTLDEADVTYMKTLDNLLPAHIFQFDFLNDGLQDNKVPEDLKRILLDAEERKKLVIYINPPYAEAGNALKKNNGLNGNKKGVAKDNKVYNEYKTLIGPASNELFGQFLIRIYKEMHNCIIANFATLKPLQAPFFEKFRRVFQAKLLSAFIVPANTFDNVQGHFPICFYIWDTTQKEYFRSITGEVFDSNGVYLGNKTIVAPPAKGLLMDWLKSVHDYQSDRIAFLRTTCSDFQTQNATFITTIPSLNDFKQRRTHDITKNNLTEIAVYYAVRKVIPATWLNDRDQFLYPRNAWKEDKVFMADCLAYTLFNNLIQSDGGKIINHWIPFREKEVNAPMLFNSHFMSDFIAGQSKTDDKQLELEYAKIESLIPSEPIQFSPEAQSVLEAGRELWKYYMTKKDEMSFNVNASYYDIRRYFQGVDDKGHMNPDSPDETYMRLWGNVKESLKVLAKRIEPKVYLYGFLLDETTLPEDEPVEIAEPENKPAKITKPKTQRKSKKQMVLNNYGTVNIYGN